VCLVCAASHVTAQVVQGNYAAPSASTTTHSQEVGDAIARFKDRDFDGALKLLKEAAKKDSNLPPAQMIMVELFAQANLPMGVRNALDRATFDSPDDPEAYIVMGDFALRERRITEAALLYQKARELASKFNKSRKRKELLEPRVLSGLATIEEIHENWAGAQMLLNAWLNLEPKNAETMQRLSRCLFLQKDAPGALAMLKRAAEADPTMLTPEAVLGQLYQRVGDRKNATIWMTEAINAAPKDVKTRMAAAQWALEMGKMDDARTQIEAAMQLDPKSLDAKILCGIVALFDKDYSRAETYLVSAHNQSPGNFAASNSLALALVEQKDEAKKRSALEYAVANVQQNPKLAEAASTCGWVLYNLGKLDDAEKAFQTAISGGQISPSTAYYMARLSCDRGRKEQARRLLEIALKSTGPFALRQDAKALLEELQK
jgi:tetratricopeptide (TPR) repeat protein